MVGARGGGLRRGVRVDLRLHLKWRCHEYQLRKASKNVTFPFYFFGTQAVESAGPWATFAFASQVEDTSLPPALRVWPRTAAPPAPLLAHLLPSCSSRPIRGGRPHAGLDPGLQAPDPASAQGSGGARLCHLCQGPGWMRRGGACQSSLRFQQRCPALHSPRAACPALFWAPGEQGPSPRPLSRRGFWKLQSQAAGRVGRLRGAGR